MRSHGQSVVLGEVSRGGRDGAQIAGESVGEGLVDVLGEPPRGGSREQDALDALVLPRTVAVGVAERSAEVVGAVALAQQQNAAGVVGCLAPRRHLERIEEGPGGLAHVAEGAAELVEICGRPPLLVGTWMVLAGPDVPAAAARSESVPRDAPQVGRIGEQLVRGDAHGEERGDVFVGHGVAVSLPAHEAVDAAQSIHDAGRVVGVTRQAAQQRLLFGKQLHPGRLRGAPTGPEVAGGVEPTGELGAQVGEIAE